MPNLGDFVRDEVSGFKGLVLARTDALYEASQCRVHSRDLMESGDVRAGVWFEEDRLVVLQEAAVVGFRSVAGSDLRSEPKPAIAEGMA